MASRSETHELNVCSSNKHLLGLLCLQSAQSSRWLRDSSGAVASGTASGLSYSGRVISSCGLSISNSDNGYRCCASLQAVMLLGW